MKNRKHRAHEVEEEEVCRKRHMLNTVGGSHRVYKEKEVGFKFVAVEVK